MREIRKIRFATSEEKQVRFEKQLEMAGSLERETFTREIRMLEHGDPCKSANIISLIAHSTLAGQLTKEFAKKLLAELDSSDRQLALAIIKRDFSNPAAVRYLNWAQDNNDAKTKAAVRHNRRLRTGY